MTRLEFDNLVRRLEVRYAGRQRALEHAAARWVVLGLTGIVAWAVLLLLLAAALLAAGAIVPLPGNLLLLAGGAALGVYGLCQLAYILQVEVTPRQGRVLGPGEAPALAAALAELGRQMQCRPFDEVRLTLDVNAGVAELPRLGLLGWPRTVLEVGVPLARAISPDELRAVLAHECVHRSARHGRTAGRLYLINQTWANLMQQLQRPATGRLDRLGRWALGKFLGWYWPRLHARTFVLARMHEYQADRHAAEVTSPAVVVGALWRLECLSPWLGDQFWGELWQSTRDCPEPPADVLRLLADACRQGPAPADAARCVERGLSRATAEDSTHPAFIDRVRPLGWTNDDVRRLGFPPPPPVSAAEHFLGDQLAELERTLSEQWRQSILASWHDRHRRACAEARRAESAPAADVHLLWETARTTADRHGLAPAVPFLRQVLEHDPNHGGACVLLGQHLTSQGDPEGERLLSAVVARGDENWLSRACAALEQCYRSHGRMEEVRQTRALLDRHEADLRAAQRERATVTRRDRFIAHELSIETLAALHCRLASLSDLGTAWLARKDLTYFPHRALFVLVVRSAGARWWRGTRDRDQALVRQLTGKLQLPGQVLVVGRHGPFRALARKVAALPEAEVFCRDGAVS